jgi:flagellar biosynthetic protein FliR
MSIDLLFCWMMVFLRAVGVLMALPAPSGQALPVTVRVAFGVVLATLVYGLVPHASAAGFGWAELMLAAAGEVLLGLLMGFAGRMIFATVALAGRLISSEIGMVAAPGFDVPVPATEPLPAFLALFAGLMFFLLGAHEGVLAAFVRSFDLAAAGRPAWNSGAAELLVDGTARVIELGVRIAAPFIALNFLMNLAFSVLGRTVSRMNVFVLSYSVRGIVGLALLSGAGMLIARYLSLEFQDLPLRMLELLPPRN